MAKAATKPPPLKTDDKPKGDGRKPAATSAKPQAVAELVPTRFVYDTSFKKEYGVDEHQWRTICDAIWPGAKTLEGVLLALSYCKARKLDPFKRPVNVVAVWNSALRREVESVWPGIGDLRTTAARSPYAGCDDVKWGPDKTEEFTGQTTWSGETRNISAKVTYPEWGQMTVYRIVEGVRCAFVGPKVYWKETYGVQGKTDVPNSMWTKRPRGQLEKCVEAAALRRACPEEIGNQYIDDEMMRPIIDQESVTAHANGDEPPEPTREDTSEAIEAYTMIDERGEEAGQVPAADFLKAIEDSLDALFAAGKRDDANQLYDNNVDEITRCGKDGHGEAKDALVRHYNDLATAPDPEAEKGEEKEADPGEDDTEPEGGEADAPEEPQGDGPPGEEDTQGEAPPEEPAGDTDAPAKSSEHQLADKILRQIKSVTTLKAVGNLRAIHKDDIANIAKVSPTGAAFLENALDKQEAIVRANKK